MPVSTIYRYECDECDAIEETIPYSRLQDPPALPPVDLLPKGWSWATVYGHTWVLCEKHSASLDIQDKGVM